MSAEIIQFITYAKRDDTQTDFPTIVFRSSVQDPKIDPVSSAADKHAGPIKRET